MRGESVWAVTEGAFCLRVMLGGVWWVNRTVGNLQWPSMHRFVFIWFRLDRLQLACRLRVGNVKGVRYNHGLAAVRLSRRIQ